MKRNIVEGYSIEEAFRALNHSAKRRSNLKEELETVDNESRDVIEALTSSWIDIQNQIALEREDGINPFYDNSTAGNYILELMGKVETELDVEVIPSVQGGYGDVYIHLGDTYANSRESVGPFNFTKFSNEMIDLVLEADTENAFIDAYRKDILAYIETDESLNESADDDFEDDYSGDFEDNTDKELTDEIIKKELLETQADYKPERSDLSFQAWVEDNAGYLYGSYIIGQEFSGAFLSAEEEAELTAIEDRVRAIANQILSKENESLNESASSGYIMVTQGFGDASYECHLEHFSERSLLVEAVLDECQVEDFSVYENLIKLPPDAFNKQLSAIVEDASENGIFDDFGVAYVKDLSAGKIIAGVDLRDEIIDMITQYASDDIAAQTAIEDLNNDRTFDFEA